MAHAGFGGFNAYGALYSVGIVGRNQYTAGSVMAPFCFYK